MYVCLNAASLLPPVLPPFPVSVSVSIRSLEIAWIQMQTVTDFLPEVRAAPSSSSLRPYDALEAVMQAQACAHPILTSPARAVAAEQCRKKAIG